MRKFNVELALISFAPSFCCSARFIDEPNTVNNRPDPADDQPCGKELQNSVEQSGLVEIAASASRDHSADSRQDNVEDETDDGESLIKLHDSVFA